MIEVVHELAMAIDGEYCASCGSKLTHYITVKLKLKRPSHTGKKTAYLNVLYCTKCKLPYINDVIGRFFYLENKQLPAFFVPDRGWSISRLRGLIYKNCNDQTAHKEEEDHSVTYNQLETASDSSKKTRWVKKRY